MSTDYDTATDMLPPSTPSHTNENKQPNTNTKSRITKKLTQYATMLSPTATTAPTTTTPASTKKLLTRQASATHLQSGSQTMRPDKKAGNGGKSTLINDATDIQALLASKPAAPIDAKHDVHTMKKHQSSTDWTDQFNVCTCIRTLIHHSADEVVMEIYTVFTLLNSYCMNSRSQLARYAIGVYRELFACTHPPLITAISKVLLDRSVGYECVMIVARQSAGRNGQFIGKEAYDTMMTILNSQSPHKVLPALLRLAGDVAADQKVKLPISEYLELLVNRLEEETVVTSDISLLCQLCCQMFVDKDAGVRRHAGNIVRTLSSRCEQYSWRSQIKHNFASYDMFLKFNAILKQLKQPEIIPTESPVKGSGAAERTPRVTRTAQSIRQRSNSIVSVVSPVKSVMSQLQTSQTAKKSKLANKTVPHSVLASIMSGNIPGQTVALNYTAVDTTGMDIQQPIGGVADEMTEKLHQVENRRFTRAMQQVASSKHQRMLSGLIDEDEEVDSEAVDEADVVMDVSDTVEVAAEPVTGVSRRSSRRSTTNKTPKGMHSSAGSSSSAAEWLSPQAVNKQLDFVDGGVAVMVGMDGDNVQMTVDVKRDAERKSKSATHSKANSVDSQRAADNVTNGSARPGTAKRLSKRNRSDTEGMNNLVATPDVSIAHITSQSTQADWLSMIDQIEAVYSERRKAAVSGNVLQMYLSTYYLPLQALLTDKLKC